MDYEHLVDTEGDPLIPEPHHLPEVQSEGDRRTYTEVNPLSCVQENRAFPPLFSSSLNSTSFPLLRRPPHPLTDKLFAS